MPRLFVADQIAGAANVQIVAGQLEPRTQRVEVAQQLQPLFGGVGDAAVIGGGQIGIGARLGPPDAAAQLVKLGKAEPVGAVDDPRVGARNIDRKSVVEGKSVSVRVNLGGRR